MQDIAVIDKTLLDLADILTSVFPDIDQWVVFVTIAQLDRSRFVWSKPIRFLAMDILQGAYKQRTLQLLIDHAKKIIDTAHEQLARFPFHTLKT